MSRGKQRVDRKYDGIYSESMTDKQMHWATIGVMLIVGFLGGYLVREIVPAASQMIPYSCTHEGKTYKSGASFPAGDGCNSCSCQNGNVACTLMACIPSGSGGSSGTGTAVVTPVPPGQSEMAKIPDLPLVSVPNPKSPLRAKYVIEHRSALNGKTVNVTGMVVANLLKREKCTGQRCPQTEIYMQPQIMLGESLPPWENPLYNLRVIVPGEAQISENQYLVGTTGTVTGQVEGNRDGVLMRFDFRLY